MMTINKDKEPTVVFHEMIPQNAMLQPIGLIYNRELQELQMGDRIKFWDGKSGVCVRVCKLDMRTQIFGALVKYLYGEYATVSRVMERWIAHAVVNGNNPNAISKTECLFIQYLPIIKKNGEKVLRGDSRKAVGRNTKKTASKVSRKGRNSKRTGTG